MGKGCRFSRSWTNIKKARDHPAVTTRKVICYIGFNIGENVGKCDVQDIIFSSELCNILRPSSQVGFTNDIQELRWGSLGGPAVLRSTKVSCYMFRFSMDGCNIPERPDNVKEPKVV